VPGNEALASQSSYLHFRFDFPQARDVMAGDILDTIDHPNQERYPGQQIHMIAIEDYVYLVPFIETEVRFT